MSAVPDRKDRPEYVSLHPSDWLGGCYTLPPMAEWVYLQISLFNMDKGEPVPGNRLAMILVRHSEWQADLDLLIELGKVHKTAGGSMFVKRALTEYQRANRALQKRRNAGKKGAEMRWGNSEIDGDAIPEDSNAIENGCLTNGSRAEQSRAEQTDPHGSGAAPGDLLFVIDDEPWSAFIEHRIKLKAPLTKRAEGMLRNELLKIHEQNGHDPNAVLRQSMMRGWKGVFPLKDDDNGKRSGWRFDDE